MFEKKDVQKQQGLGLAGLSVCDWQATFRQEKRAQRLSFWVRRPPGGVGVFHAKGWWPKTSCPPSKLCLPWVSKRGIRDVPGILPGCPGPLAVFKKFVQKNFVRIFRSLFLAPFDVILWALCYLPREADLQNPQAHALPLFSKTLTRINFQSRFLVEGDATKHLSVKFKWGVGSVGRWICKFGAPHFCLKISPNPFKTSVFRQIRGKNGAPQIC